MLLGFRIEVDARVGGVCAGTLVGAPAGGKLPSTRRHRVRPLFQLFLAMRSGVVRNRVGDGWLDGQPMYILYTSSRAVEAPGLRRLAFPCMYCTRQARRTVGEGKEKHRLLEGVENEGALAGGSQLH